MFSIMAILFVKNEMHEVNNPMNTIQFSSIQFNSVYSISNTIPTVTKFKITTFHSDRLNRLPDRHKNPVTVFI